MLDINFNIILASFYTPSFIKVSWFGQQIAPVGPVWFNHHCLKYTLKCKRNYTVRNSTLPPVGCPLTVLKSTRCPLLAALGALLQFNLLLADVVYLLYTAQWRCSHNAQFRCL